MPAHHCTAIMQHHICVTCLPRQVSGLRQCSFAHSHIVMQEKGTARFCPCCVPAGPGLWSEAMQLSSPAGQPVFMERAPPDSAHAACLQGHASGLRWCEIVDEGRRIVTVSGNRLINLWDLKTGECIQTFPSESLPACLPGTCMSWLGPLGAGASLTGSGPRSDLSRVRSAMPPAMSAWHKYCFSRCTWTACLLASMFSACPLHASGSLLCFSRRQLALASATFPAPKCSASHLLLGNACVTTNHLAAVSHAVLHCATAGNGRART